jgi:ubiquitin-conjugating enzyme E2 variant
MNPNMSPSPEAISNVPLFAAGDPDVTPHGAVHRAMEGAGIVVAWSLVAVVAARATLAAVAGFTESMTLGRGVLLLLLLAVPAGYVLADLFSGLVHFTFDRFFSVHTPWLGKNFVAPFRIHHTDPEDITKHGFLETNGNCCLATVPALAPIALVDLDAHHPVTLFLVVTFAVATVGVFLTNQIHKWAHMESPPAVVAWMQRHNLVLGPAHHAVHHTGPHDSHYCITTGWLNEPLNKLNLWRRLENVGEKMGAELYRS